MLAIRFVRHGESLANAGGVTSEQYAIPLTDLGRAQAVAFAEALDDPPDLFITSSYIRARDTAAPSLARYPHVPVDVWPVHEIAVLAPARCVNTTTTQRLPWVEAHWGAADPARCDGEGAETYTEFVARVRAALARLAALPRPQEIIAFGHGQFLNGVLWEIGQGSPPVTPETMRGFRAFHLAAPIPNLGGFTARWDGTRWTIEKGERHDTLGRDF
jgi:2,3-bisphosphoglycerate-dependent phosphoglycerate mutase